MAQTFQDFLGIDYPARSGKPRQSGLTMVMDTGWPTSFVESMLDQYGEYLDVVKIWDPHLRAPEAEVRRKIEVYNRYNVRVQPGGRVSVYTGALAMGQGLKTNFAAFKEGAKNVSGTFGHQIAIDAIYGIIVSLLLAHFHSPYWLWFTGFVGLNLFQSGFTQFCLNRETSAGRRINVQVRSPRDSLYDDFSADIAHPDGDVFHAIGLAAMTKGQLYRVLRCLRFEERCLVVIQAAGDEGILALPLKLDLDGLGRDDLRRQQ